MLVVVASVGACVVVGRPEVGVAVLMGMLIAAIVGPVAGRRRRGELLGLRVELQEAADLLRKCALIDHGELSVVPGGALLAEREQLLRVGALQKVEKPFFFVAELGWEAGRRAHRVGLAVHIGRREALLLLHAELGQDPLLAERLMPERQQSLQLKRGGHVGAYVPAFLALELAD